MRARAGLAALAALGLAALVLAAGALAAGAAPAEAGPAPLRTGINDPAYRSASAGARATAFERTEQARADIVRINVNWRSLIVDQDKAPEQPGVSTSSGYDAAIWARYDAGVAEARARGLIPLLTVFIAPDFAEGAKRPNGAPQGTWRPRPGAVRAFALALSRRYSGDRHSSAVGEHAVVRHFQAWNEPNLRGYLSPQRQRGNVRSAGIYRSLLNAFREGVRGDGGAPQPIVLTAGTSAYGDPSGPGRVRPLEFWRRVLCVGGRARLSARPCPERPRFDTLAHHPITTSGGPLQAALDHDDVAIADLGRLRRVLRFAERAGSALPAGSRPIWVTEFWWRSNPPTRASLGGVPLARHARWIQRGMYELWRRGARVAITHLISDPAPQNGQVNEFAGTGLFNGEGDPKPALRAFRFPFVGVRQNPNRIGVWGRSPAAGTLRILQRRPSGNWGVVATRNVAAGDTFRATLQRQRRQAPWRLRAEIAGEQPSIVSAVR